MSASRYVRVDGEAVPLGGGGGDPMIEMLPTPSLGWPASVTKIVIPDDVTGGIGDYAFYGCVSLTELVLPSGMTGSIGAYAFTECSSLTELVLPSGITGSIGTRAFSGCSSLTEITLLSPSLITLSNVNAFADCPADIYVPANLVDDYKAAANWSTFAARIYPIPD